MKRSVRGKRIILTGATSGIGWCLAIELFRAGGELICTGRRENRLADLVAACDFERTQAESFGTQSTGSIATVAGDLTDPSFRSGLVEFAKQRWNGLDLLINNAGAGAIGKFEEASTERLRRVMEIDFFAPVELTRQCLPLLLQGNSPAISLIGSVLGHRAVPNKSEYCAAKFALRGWAESLRCELAGEGIDVIMISPSTTQTEFFESLVDSAAGAKSKSFGAVAPERVAWITRRAIERGSREVIISLGGKALVWSGRLIPNTLDRLLERYGS